MSKKIRINNQLVVLFGLLMCVFLLRVPSLNQPLENDSAAIAYHARIIVRGEPLYSTHHTAHHMPGTYYIFALAFKLFGESVFAIKLVLIFWITATVFFIYQIGLIINGHRAGIISAIFSAFLFSHLGLAGTTAKPELFVNLPRVLSILLLFYCIKNNAPPKYYFWIGLCNGFIFIIKINYISPLAIAGIFLLHELWVNRKRTNILHSIIPKGAWISVGFLLPITFVIIYFSYLGLLSSFLEIFKLGFGYIHLIDREQTSLIFTIVYPILVLSSNNLVILVLALTNVFLIIYGFLKNQSKTISPSFFTQTEQYLTLWFIFCFLETSISRTYLTYYYLVYIPPLVILLSTFLEKTANVFSQVKSTPQVLLSIITLAFVFSLYTNHKYYSAYILYALKQTTYQTFLDNGLPDGAGQTISHLQEIAQYITYHTSKEDTIYYWSSLMDLYFMLDRRSSYEIIWPYYAGSLGHREEIFTATYFLVGDNSLGIEATPQWLIDGLAQNYKLETILYNQYIYRHK